MMPIRKNSHHRPVPAMAGASGGVPVQLPECAAHPGAPVFIGIAGPKRSGKDTLAAGLAKCMGLRRDSFAAPIRRFAAELVGITDLDILEIHKETPVPWLDGKTPRELMQTLGTEWGRDMVHPDLWIRSLFARLRDGGIISDVRFANEAAEIRARGGVIVRISRNGTGHVDRHSSEKPIPGNLVDFEVSNDGTPDDMLFTVMAHLRDHGLG